MFNPEIETLPHAKLRALQNERLRNVLERVYENVPFYRRMFDEQGLKPHHIKGVDDLEELPFTRKQHLREGYPFGLFAVPQREIVRLHASSGTTGKPTIVGYTRHDLGVFAEVVARSMAAAGARPGMIFHNAYGYGLFTGGLGLHYGGERLGVTVIPVSGGMTERQVTLIQDLKPQVIACTPSYAQTLAEALAQAGVDPQETSLKYAILGAEPWTEAIRRDVERGLGVKATNIYGLSEIIGPGVSNEDVSEQDGAYIWEDHFYPEIVHPETGERLPEGEAGVLVLTTLTKEALPLIRYWTGDITTLTREVGASGRTHARMGMVRGRSDDMLIIRGVNLYPTQIEEILADVPEVALHYQLALSRPHTLDELELRLELTQEAFRHLGGDLTREESAQVVREVCRRVQGRIKDRVGITAKVTLLAPGTAPRSAGGKLRRIVDERAL
jgi:phenylacetate-CoA ligase